MQVKVTPKSHLVFNDKEYTEGDTVDLPDDIAQVQLQAGMVEEINDKKGKK